MTDSSATVKEKIKILNNQKLCSMSIEAVRKILFNSITFPYQNYPQISGSKIFRGQICSKATFDQISRISYNPEPAKVIGRANMINESIFYSATALDTAAIESCQDGIRFGKRDFFVTIGEWVLQKTLEINIMCHSKKAQLTGTDLPIAAKSIEPMMRKGKTEDQYQALLAKSEFFSDQFAKSSINCSNDYAYSALYSSQILEPSRKICDAILYPSVAYKLKGFNLVYNKNLIDNKTIKFNCAYMVRLKFINLDVYPEFEIQKKSVSFKDDKIFW